MKRLILTGLIAFVVSAVAVQTSAETINPQDKLDEYLSKDIQISLGFDGLTMSQRIKVAALIDSAYEQGLKAGKIKGSAEAVVESQIDGEFEGWDGETIVKLMNGQIWQQTEYYYSYSYSYMANVLVYRSLGGYKMHVKGMDKPILVTRLK